MKQRQKVLSRQRVSQVWAGGLFEGTSESAAAGKSQKHATQPHAQNRLTPETGPTLMT